MTTDASPAAPPTPKTISSTLKTLKVKMSNVINPSSDHEVEPLTPEEIQQAYDLYIKVQGASRATPLSPARTSWQDLRP